MKDKIYRSKNRLSVFFTEEQMAFLDKMKKETGDCKSSIIRRALTNFMYLETKKNGYYQLYPQQKW